MVWSLVLVMKKLAPDDVSHWKIETASIVYEYSNLTFKIKTLPSLVVNRNISLFLLALDI